VFVWLMLFFLFPSIEEAAMDLGCTPLKTFFVVTLQVITPALASDWLLVTGYWLLVTGVYPIIGRSGDCQLCVWPRRHNPANGGVLVSAHGCITKD
jgi:hypothetical protein